MEMHPLPVRIPAIGGNPSSTVSLRAIFQNLSACCLFFAVFRISPVAALVATLLLAPAIVRTTWISIQYDSRKMPFDLGTRMLVFAASTGIVLMSAAIAAAVFAVVLVGCAMFGMLFGMAVSSADFYMDSLVAGAIGGMIWALAAGGTAFCYTMIISWAPVELRV